MLVSIDWVKDFVDVPNLSPQELSSKFTLATAEVEEVMTSNEYLEKMSVVEIIKIDKHPDADKIRLVTFNLGNDKTKQVVCGAANVRLGLKTPYAPIGTSLPNGLLLEPKKIRGFLSEGMLCSEEELALAETSEGIMELPESTQVGQSMLEYFKATKDTILDIDNKSLTHRPDLWGMYGMAREFSAIFELPLADKFNKNWEADLKKNLTKDTAPMKVKVDKDCAGLAYFGLSLNNIAVQESPKWLKDRLLAVGLRPINNIVDISNYVMLELGIPLHIFDRDKIKGDTVHIKQAGKNINFTTLDEVERELLSTDTIISDSEEALVIAGIMGGLNSGVTTETKNIFIEVANWKAADVRKTSTRLGLRTDSSQRYEKTLDSQLLERTLFRTLELIKELSPKANVIGDIQYDGLALDDFKPLKLKISPSQITRVLGKDITTEKIISIFEKLDFKVSKSDSEVLEILVPSYRSTKDIQYKEDLIEEIGRIVGYDNITPISPELDIAPVKLSSAGQLHRSLKDFLVFHCNSFEVMTYPLIGESLLKKALFSTDDSLKLINAISTDQEQMRPSLIPSLIEVAAKNTKNFDHFKFFELGRTYENNKTQKSFCDEKSMLAVATFSRDKSAFTELLNDLDKLFVSCNIPADFCNKHPKFLNNVVDEKWKGLHPLEFQNIRLMGKMNGCAFSVHPLLLRSFKIKGHLSIALLDLSLLESKPIKEKTNYKPLDKFPPSTFDWTVMASKDAMIADILAPLGKLKLPELKSYKVVSTFDTPEGKTVTLKATLGDSNKTLSGDFLKEAREKLVGSLESVGYLLKN